MEVVGEEEGESVCWWWSLRDDFSESEESLEEKEKEGRSGKRKVVLQQTVEVVGNGEKERVAMIGERMRRQDHDGCKCNVRDDEDH